MCRHLLYAAGREYAGGSARPAFVSMARRVALSFRMMILSVSKPTCQASFIAVRTEADFALNRHWIGK